MERALLWVSLAVGIVVFLFRFLPGAAGENGRVSDNTPLRADLRLAVLLAPPVGFLLTLPTGGLFFGPGQKLGWGFLIGGAAMLAAQSGLLHTRAAGRGVLPAVRLASAYGPSLVAVAVALLYLRQSLLDGLMGVAIGGFAVAFALLLALPHGARTGAAGRHLAVSAGFLVTLAVGAGLGAYRDPLTPELAKLTWSGLLVAFAALGTLLTAGVGLLPLDRAGQMGHLAPLALLVALGGFGLYEMAVKLTGSGTLGFIGIGGLLLWPVALATLRETARRSDNAPAEPLPVAPLLLTALVITGGFLVALQSLRGVGVAAGVLALFLSFPATFALVPPLGADAHDENEAAVPTASVGLLLFATVLLLWRFFVTRWEGDLRGVNLSDQYALFGLIVGAGLPSLLTGLSVRGRGADLVTLGVTGALSLAAPAALLVLFGAKSAPGFLIGLALGALPSLAPSLAGASLLRGLLAVGVALALAQWTGHILPDDAPTRLEKIRLLAGIGAAIVVLAITGARRGRVADGQTNAGGTE